MGDSRPSAVHIPSLDGVRGIAVLAVMALHFTMYGGLTGANSADALFRNIAGAGWVGVDLFFVLSGFLITGILLDTKGDDGYFSTFYMRRTLRIFPLYFAFLVVVLLVMKPIWGHTVLFDDFDGGPWYWTYLTNWWISFEGWPRNPALGHLWSLAVEEQFYLIWPLVVLSLSRKRLITVSLLLVVSGPVIRAGFGYVGMAEAADVNILSRMDTLAIGGLIAALARGPNGLKHVRPWIQRFGMAAFVLIVAVWLARGGFDGSDPVVYTVGFSFVAMASAWLIVEAMQPDRPRLRLILSNGRLTTLGKYSYGLYVIHGPVSIWLPQWFGAEDFPRVAGSYIPAQLTYWAVGMGLSFALALVSSRVIERPFLELKKRFGYKGDLGSGHAHVVPRPAAER